MSFCCSGRYLVFLPVIKKLSELRLSYRHSRQCWKVLGDWSIHLMLRTYCLRFHSPYMSQSALSLAVLSSLKDIIRRRLAILSINGHWRFDALKWTSFLTGVRACLIPYKLSIYNKHGSDYTLYTYPCHSLCTLRYSLLEVICKPRLKWTSAIDWSRRRLISTLYFIFWKRKKETSERCISTTVYVCVCMYVCTQFSLNGANALVLYNVSEGPSERHVYI